jgi:transposase
VLAEQFDVYPNQIASWKDQLLEGAAEVFERGGNGRSSAPEVDIKTLHAKIGELTLENDFLNVRSARRDWRAQSDVQP